MAMIDLVNPRDFSRTISPSGNSSRILACVRRFQSGEVFLGHQVFIKSIVLIWRILGRKKIKTGSHVWLSIRKYLLRVWT